MDRFEYREILEFGPRGGMKHIGVVWDRMNERIRIKNISKYQAKVWMRENQEEMLSYEETER